MAKAVTVYCRLPMGLRLDHPDYDSITAFGSSHPDAEGDRGERIGVTRGVDAKFWDAWRSLHFRHPILESDMWAEPEDEPGADEREPALAEVI